MTRAARTLALILLFASLAAALPAQSANDEEWYIGKPISDFAFTGLVTVKADDLRAIVKPYIGSNFSLELLWEAQAKLFALDSFESIEPNANPADETRAAVVIEFVVKERPAISAIEISGNTGVRSGEILDKIVLKKGDLSNPGKLKADEEAIRALYLDKGYTDIAVTGSTLETETPGTVKLSFQIVEGLPTTIREVRFSGNSFASESTLRNLMKTKPQALFNSGVFQEAKLAEDTQAIVDYYGDHGYVDAKVERVERTIETQEGRRSLVLTVYLTEGEQWIYGGVTFSGNQIFPTDRLAALVTQKQGKPVSAKKLQADFQRVQGLYYENGYIFNPFDLKENREANTHTISYTMAITEFDKAHIESIIFKGNTKTDDSVLRRGLPFQEGDIFNRAKVIEGYQYLVNLQYFKTVQPEFPQGSAPGLMNVVFNLEETSTADINFGVVFSGGDFPVSGTIKWNERDFRGMGQTVGVNLEASPIKQTVALSFYEPWVLGVPWSAGISLSFVHSSQRDVLQDILAPIFTDDQVDVAAPDPYSTHQEYLDAVAAGVAIPPQYLMTYDSYDLSFGLNSGYRFKVPFGALGVRGSWAPQLRRIDYDTMTYRPYEKSVRDNQGNVSFIDKLSASVYLDGRDFYLNPTKGYYASQALGFTGGILFGNRHYIRSDTALEGFLKILDLPVFENWSLQYVLAAHSGVSLILPQYHWTGVGTTWAWGSVTDYTDLLYIDGMTVGRGWRQTYGHALWDNKIELRMPFAKEVLWGVTFFDAAALWDSPEAMGRMSLNDFYFSFGMGLRFTIPQFPIRLYLGKGFRVRDGVVVWKDGDLDLGNNVTLSFIISLGGDVF
jgi:outer membrane protein insertion porin family